MVVVIRSPHHAIAHNLQIFQMIRAGWHPEAGAGDLVGCHYLCKLSSVHKLKSAESV